MMEYREIILMLIVAFGSFIFGVFLMEHFKSKYEARKERQKNKAFDYTELNQDVFKGMI